MAISSIKLEVEVSCDACSTTARVKVRVSMCDLRSIIKGDSGLDEKDLPDLWEYHRSGGWGMTGYTRTQLLCPVCVPKWREESVLEHITRKANEKPRRRKK